MRDELVETLAALGFSDCGMGIWQRKTKHTNQIVYFVVASDKVTISHGAANIEREYASKDAPSTLWLEMEVCRATFSQLLPAIMDSDE
jgi:hypothetical protein